jgi:predicted alpha/beta hydrolase
VQIKVERIALPDSSFVAATFFTPPEPRASVVISAAMGVTQKFYLSFAQWLAMQGYAVTTYDYRGMGLSAPTSLRNYKMNITDWARHDAAAVIAATKSRAPQLPLYKLGHSLGAQIIGMIPNRELIDGVVMVASGSGYWRETSPQTKRNSRFMWYVLAPVITPLVGYFPGKTLRGIGDLPRGVVEQWRRWCLHPDYLLGVEGAHTRDAYASIRSPMLCMSFTDDEMMSATSTDALYSFYPNASIERVRLAPNEVDERRIGHFGFFKPQLENKLWARTTTWLERQCAQIAT